jgi:hypothetical protein
MASSSRAVHILLTGLAALALAAPATGAPTKFEEARLYIEYNSTDNALGFHVSLDAEDWRTVEIINPAGVVIFNATGRGPYGRPGMGLSEMFFEGAEPSLDDVPLDALLSQFPEGKYKFVGMTADGARLSATSVFTHAVPDGPAVSSEVTPDAIVIRWRPVTGPPPGFPSERIQIVGYQVLVDPFEVTLPATSTQVTLPREFADSLAPGPHGFEVLAIDASGNQTITAGSFDTP